MQNENGAIISPDFSDETEAGFDFVGGPVVLLTTPLVEEYFEFWFHISDRVPRPSVEGEGVFSPRKFRVYRYGGSVEGVVFPIASNFDILLSLAMLSFTTGHWLTVKTVEYDLRDMRNLNATLPALVMEIGRPGDRAG